MTRKLKQSLIKQKQSNKQVVQQITGILGLPLDGQRRVEVSNRNSYVYVRLRNNESEVIQAFNNQVAPAYNLPVLVERQGNRYVVIGVDTQRYENNWNSFAPFLPRHGNTHSFNLETGGGGDIVWVYSPQIIPLLGMPSGSLGAPNVFVNAYTLKNDNGTWKYIGNTGTQNLTTYNPTSPTGAIIVLVYVDSVSGNPGFLVGSGTVFSNSITGANQITPYIPTITNPSWIPDVAVRLITGTSQISWNNLYDVRQWLHTTPTGTGGGSSSGIDTLGFAGLDEGIPLGTGTSLNVVGAGATFTRSGTMFNLEIPGGGSGVSAQDEGVPLGTGTVFNFVGNNVHASISGSVVRVFVTGSSGGAALTVDDYAGGTVSNVNRITFTGTANPFVVDDGGGHALVNIQNRGVDVLDVGGTLGEDVARLEFDESDVSFSGTVARISFSPEDGPQGFGYNYVVTPSLSSGTLNVSLKTMAGTNPSPSDKLVFRVSDVRREITSALSVSIATGTNWMGAGSAELAGKAVEYFVYLIQETGASAGTKIGISRIPYARIMNDFINLSTDEKYIAGNWTNFNTDDEVENIGRIRATKASAVGGWTTFSSLSISQPIYHTNWLEWFPAVVGFLTDPAFVARYKLIDNLLHLAFAQDAAATSDSTLFTVTMPFTAKNETNYFQYSSLPFTINNGVTEAAGLVFATPNSTTLILKRTTNAAWTASGNKNTAFNIAIEI